MFEARSSKGYVVISCLSGILETGYLQGSTEGVKGKERVRWKSLLGIGKAGST